jgi:hypothetical protein
MTDPWDRPPFPTCGDDAEDSTYVGVGRVLSQWENVELGLSHIYAMFINKPFSIGIYDQYYDDAKTFRQRLATVTRRGERFFQRHPDQSVEGDFSHLMKKVGGFSERRHEVAHGFVRPIQWYSVALPNMTIPDDAPFQFCVVPPHYQGNWFDTNSMPKYVYTSKELTELERLIFFLSQEVGTFRYRLQKLGTSP